MLLIVAIISHIIRLFVIMIICDYVLQTVQFATIYNTFNHQHKLGNEFIMPHLMQNVVLHVILDPILKTL